jgi:WD40 repeat protein
MTFAPSAGSNGNIQMWDMRTDKLVQLYAAHNGAVRDFSFHPSGEAVSHADELVIPQAKPLSCAMLVPANVYCSFWYAGRLLISSSDDGSLRRWALREGRLTHTLHAHKGAVCSTSFSPSGQSS